MMVKCETANLPPPAMSSLSTKAITDNAGLLSPACVCIHVCVYRPSGRNHLICQCRGHVNSARRGGIICSCHFTASAHVSSATPTGTGCGTHCATRCCWFHLSPFNNHTISRLQLGVCQVFLSHASFPPPPLKLRGNHDYSLLLLYTITGVLSNGVGVYASPQISVADVLGHQFY